MKETLEEAGERISKLSSVYETGQDDVYQGFIRGAQWQAERSYTEEEVKALIIRAVDEFSAFHSNTLKMQCAEEFFDKNKK